MGGHERIKRFGDEFFGRIVSNKRRQDHRWAEGQFTRSSERRNGGGRRTKTLKPKANFNDAGIDAKVSKWIVSPNDGEARG